MTDRKNRRNAAVVAGLAAVGLAHGLGAPPVATACGGFFCSLDAPVEQSAEEIVFVHNPDGTVTAVVRILYQGPSEKFAWVLPIAGVPEVSVSSNAAFDSLRSATDPQYFVNRKRSASRVLPEPARAPYAERAWKASISVRA